MILHGLEFIHSIIIQFSFMGYKGDNAFCILRNQSTMKNQDAPAAASAHVLPANQTASVLDIITHKPSRLFIILGGFFVVNALTAQFIGVKIFALEDTLGIRPWNFNLFGQEGAL